MTNQQVAHYTLIRLLPHADAGEFVNIGVVLASPGRRRLDFELLQHVGRVTRFFPEFTGSLFRQVRNELRDELNHVAKQVAFGTDALTVLTELCRPREALIRYATVRTLFSRTPEATLTQLMARFVERDGMEVGRRREELLNRRVRQTLAAQQLGKLFADEPVGDADFRVRLPFVHRRAGVTAAIIKPLDLALEEPQKIYDHADHWIPRLRRLQHMKLIDGDLLMPIDRPSAEEARCLTAANQVADELSSELRAMVVRADDAAPIIAFAQRYAAD